MPAARNASRRWPPAAGASRAAEGGLPRSVSSPRRAACASSTAVRTAAAARFPCPTRSPPNGNRSRPPRYRSESVRGRRPSGGWRFSLVRSAAVVGCRVGTIPATERRRVSRPARQSPPEGSRTTRSARYGGRGSCRPRPSSPRPPVRRTARVPSRTKRRRAHPPCCWRWR